MLTWPVASLGWVVTIVQRAAASQQRINEFLHTRPAIQSGKLTPPSFEGGIEFRNVTFTYANSGISAVKNLNFRIPPGSSMGIIGRTGSGKSTIANLILRLLDPDEGAILVDENNLRELDLGWYRSQTGYVAQDVFLFSDTIENNIAFGLKTDHVKQENSEQVRQAAADAAILKNILEFPEDFRTRVGERGITLSGGQKQRISIARAIIRRPAILIFDDCLSAVDTRTEAEILSNLDRVIKKSTTVVISHRISSVRQAGHILVLENGTIVEEGTHETLLKRKGHYYQMHLKQSLEKEVYP
jgi:ATP-binding cassette subfamily B protein